MEWNLEKKTITISVYNFMTTVNDGINQYKSINMYHIQTLVSYTNEIWDTSFRILHLRWLNVVNS